MRRLIAASQAAVAPDFLSAVPFDELSDPQAIHLLTARILPTGASHEICTHLLIQAAEQRTELWISSYVRTRSEQHSQTVLCHVSIIAPIVYSNRRETMKQHFCFTCIS